jgi:putative phage-type endonuclease
MPYDIVDLVQGTAEWLEWRNQGIGASDAPTIMGENPWRSAATLLAEKLDGTIVAPSAAMARGTALEPEARREYEREVGVRVSPACLQSTQHDWLRASVDGLSPDRLTVVEIKCGERVYLQTEELGDVPSHYFGQVQHILAVTGLPAIDFFCYWPGQPTVLVAVERDEGYIERLLKAEAGFWSKVSACRA